MADRRFDPCTCDSYKGLKMINDETDMESLLAMQPVQLARIIKERTQQLEKLNTEIVILKREVARKDEALKEVFRNATAIATRAALARK